MPNRETRPGTPCCRGPDTTKSPAGRPGPTNCEAHMQEHRRESRSDGGRDEGRRRGPKAPQAGRRAGGRAGGRAGADVLPIALGVLSSCAAGLLLPLKPSNPQPLLPWVGRPSRPAAAIRRAGRAGTSVSQHERAPPAPPTPGSLERQGQCRWGACGSRTWHAEQRRGVGVRRRAGQASGRRPFCSTAGAPAGAATQGSAQRRACRTRTHVLTTPRLDRTARRPPDQV